jgi:HYR domain-containing protein
MFRFESDAGATFQCKLDAAPEFTGCSSPQTYTGLGDGSHTFEVKATLGTDEGPPASYQWTINTTPADTTPPETTLTPTISGTSASFAFSSSEPGTFACSLDGAAFSSCSSPVSHTVSEGSHTFSVKAVDAAGNEDPTPASTAWTVDTTAPDTSISDGPPAVTRSRSATFTFSSEAGATFECQLDGGAFAACTSPMTYNNLGDGNHTFSVQARDVAGNTDATPASRTWKVDSSGPDLQVPARHVVEATSAAGAVVVFSVTASDNGEAVLPGSISCSPSSGRTFPLGTTPVSCQVTDPSGNSDSKSFDVVVVDTTAPLPQPPGDLTVVATSAAGIESTHQAIRSFVGRARARDLVDPSPQVRAELPPILPVGTSQVRFVFSDRTGNQVAVLVRVTVVELVPGRQAGQVISIGQDRLAPADPSGVQVRGGAGTAQLVWRNPGAADFDHVDIYRSEASEGPRTIQAVNEVRVYRGRGTSFKDRRVKGGVQYRYAVVSFDKAGNRSLGAVVAVVPKRSFLVSPREGARVAKPPVLRWGAADGARFFNVQVFRGTTKVLSVWPTGKSLKLSRSWRYGGRVHRLVRGVYRWYVWPGFGSLSSPRYGALMGERTFTVTAAKKKPGR